MSNVCVCEEGCFGHKIFEKIISLENLLTAWLTFKKGKEQKCDVQQFAINLEDNLFNLHNKLKNNRYSHSHYNSFYLYDPKLRHIHKAEVKDRILHHAVFQVIESLFEKAFIYDSYSSRKGKGTHKAVKRLQKLAWRLSRNDTRTVWVLQWDIQKFFASVDHDILIDLIKKKITNTTTIELIETIIRSFNNRENKGIPLGNLTSQLFANIYLHLFDQFVKRTLRVKSYLRYADDFVILDKNQLALKNLLPSIEHFLSTRLRLQLHPQKMTIRKWRQGVDFLGYVCFPYHTILRTKTKRRIYRKILVKYEQLKGGLINQKSFYQSWQSYCRILHHCRAFAIKRRLKSLLNL